ncbi:MAG: SMC family ATPase [Candidatus Hydrothermarchaeales archaeon]
MIIETVELKNFRSYKNAVVEFDKGVNVIVGENGAGKTSILEAIDFALFRETPSRVKVNELITRGVESEGLMVALTFQANGRRFRVERTRGKAASDKLFQDGTMLTGDEKESQTTKEVEGSIHMDKKLFANAVYIKQGEIDALLSQDPADRKKLMGRLIGTEDLENAWNSMPALIDAFEGRLERGLEEKIEDAGQKISEAELRMRALNEELSRIKESLKAENEKLEGIKKNLDGCGLLDDELSEVLNLFRNSEGLKKDLEKIKEYRVKVEEDKKGYERYVEFTEKLDELKDVESDGKVAIEELQAKWMETISELKGKIEGKKAGESRIRKAVNELEEVDDRCPICGQDLDEEHKGRIFEEYEDEMKKLKEERAQLEKGLKKTEEAAAEEHAKAIAELKASFDALEGKRQKYADSYKEYLAAESFLKKFASDEDKLKEDIAAIDEKLSVKWGSIEGNAKEAGFYDRLQTMPKEEWQSSVRSTRQEIQRSLDSINDELKKLEREQGRLEGELKAAGIGLEEHKKELKSMEAKTVENEKLLRFISLLKEIRVLFDKDHLQRELRVRHKPRIERYTREHFDKFNLAYTDVALTDDYSIKVYDSQGEKSADMLSGGERIAAALALRFGIANDLLESASAMELMILDEPTIHLDEHRRQELVEIVKRLSSIPQTIVVTHDREFEAAADKLISVRKEDGVSSVEYGGG